MVLLIGDKEAAEEFISGIECAKISRDCPYGITDAATYQLESTIYIWYTKDAPLSVKCHEIAHATFFLMDTVGLHFEDQEAFCYLFEYIIQQCIDEE